jgi:hypothetical protein
MSKQTTMKANDLPNGSQHLQDLGDGVVKLSLDQGAIMAYTVSELNTNAVKYLVADMVAMLDLWSPEIPYILLMDVSQCTPNKLSRQQAIQVSNYRPEISGRVAIIISNSVQWQVTRNVLESAFSETGRERRLFMDRDTAISWLREAMP